MSESELLPQDEKVFIETYSSTEILQADLEILGVLLISLLYYIMAGLIWTNK